MKVPLLRVWMRRLHCLFLDRTNPRDGLRVILAAIDDIKRGISIFVFPEERVPKPVRWHLSRRALSFKISTKTGCAIIPVAITGTDEILRNHMPFVKKDDRCLSLWQADLSGSVRSGSKKSTSALTHKVLSQICFLKIKIFIL